MRAATGQALEASQKNVVVVENDPTILTSLKVMFRQHGFNTSGVPDREGMLELFKEKQEFDVAVLDINLEGQQSHATTGLDIGQEIIESQPDLPPQRIVYSGHTDLDYYKAAAQMGVDDYIEKTAPDREKILVSRVRTSSLIRSLSPVRLAISDKLGGIAEKDFDPLTAIEHVCLQVIAPEVAACLGVPCVFLLSDRNGTRIVVPGGGGSGEPAEAFEFIQDKIFDAGNNDPFIFSLGGADAPRDGESRESLRVLEGGSFIPLHEGDGLRLSLGILPAEDTDLLKSQKDHRQFADYLHHRLREPVVKQFKYLSRIMKTIEKTKLRHTSSFCLYVSKTQIDVLEESLEREEIEPDNRCFLKLKRLADDLRATGAEFSQLIEVPGRARAAAAAGEKVAAREVVEQAWQMLVSQGLVNGVQLQQEEGDLELRVGRRDLLVAVLRMLQWLAQRADRIPPEVENRVVKVAYEKYEGHDAIRFTDQSRRLGEQLRRKLFEPFTQSTEPSGDIEEKAGQLPGLYLPLYLAKTLITVKNGGRLEDRTAELPGNLGHCFVMRFPTEREETPEAENG